MNHHLGPLLNGILRSASTDPSPPANGPGLPTGFRELDAFTGFLTPGSLTVIASRPGMGRTTLLADICRHNAITGGVPTLAYTLEETREAWAKRVLAAECRVPIARFENGTLTDEDHKRLADVRPAVAAAPFYLRSPARIEMTQLSEQAAEAVSEFGVRFIAVDGIQDIRPEKRSDLREREVGDAVRDLKTLARELNIPVLATAHLNRSPEYRIGHRPQLDDLRESGAVTFAADSIVFLHRPDYYEAESPRAGEADLIVAKQRSGPVATITVAAQLHYSRFVDMAQI